MILQRYLVYMIMPTSLLLKMRHSHFSTPSLCYSLVLAVEEAPPEKMLVHYINYVCMYLVETLLKDPLNEGHNTFNLSIKDNFCGPYRTMVL